MKSAAWLADSIEEVESRLLISLNDGFSPSLAIVFASIGHDLKALGSCFGKHDIDVFGSGSAGEILNNEVREGSIVVLLLEIDREAYRINIFDGADKTYHELGKSIAEWAQPAYPEPALMAVVGGLMADGDQIIKGIVDTMGRQVPLFGGLAGNDQLPQETVVFDSSQVLSNGACVLAFNQAAIELRGVAVSGWMGIGTTKTVTKSRGNLVFEIDNQPVLDIYQRYLGLDDDPQICVEHPLLMMRDDESYVVRAAMRLNDDGSMSFSGTVPEGAKVRFSCAPGLEIVDHSIEKLSQTIQTEFSPDAIVLFSCKLRHSALGPLIENELSAIRELWNVPMVGFFTFGEIGPHPNGPCDFHGTAIVPVLIREKQSLEGHEDEA
jgi:hypothetical protein